VSRDTREEEIALRPTRASDLSIFYDQELDAEARRRVAFVDPATLDRTTFDEQWQRRLTNPATIARTILSGGSVAGHIVRFAFRDQPTIGYWLGREYWGRGVATRALRLYLREDVTRPLYARVAVGNTPSVRVLEKCGFLRIDQVRSYFEPLDREIDEFVLELRGSPPD
jgi:RimJ/RimL family protein N-acetyltransferase